MPPKQQPKVKLCSYPTCPVECKPGQLACRTHWFALPSRLRDRLVFAWEQRKAHPDIPELVNIHRTLLLEALRAWGIPEDIIRAQIAMRAPKAIQTGCPMCGLPGGIHRPGCPRLGGSINDQRN